MARAPVHASTLFTRQPMALQASYSEIKRQAFEQPSLLIGTPGSVGVREISGRTFYYRQFYDAQGKKAAEYIGAVGAPEAEDRAAALREQIAVATGLVAEGRLLGQHGYVRVDPRTRAILAALANRGLFRAGAVLVGSHAYGALLNELGIRAAAFATEDVDIARAEPLEIALAKGEDFATILAGSTVPLHPIPSLDRAPPTSWKPPGPDRLRVDLLVPARGSEVTTRAVPELRAHATAVPHLRELLLEPLDAVAIGREGIVPLRVPRPEALAWHKMLVSQLRSSTSEKRNKDLAQASVLFAVLTEDAPDALAAALAAVPPRARTNTRAGAKVVLQRLEATRHERAVELMRSLVGS
jgi:hypothetical protein